MTGRHTAAAGRLPVERIETTVLSLPLEPPFRAAVRTFDRVVVIVVEARTRDGGRGTGCGFAFSIEDARVIVSAIEMLRSVVTGVDASRPESVWSRMKAASMFLGSSGVSLAAAGIIDTAIWDLSARAAGMPLWRLLGGARDRILAYGSGGSLSLSTGGLVEEMERFAASGYSAVKLKLGSRRDGGDPTRLTAMRRALGETIRLAADGNQQWSAKQAIATAHRLAEFDLWWLEEPLPAASVEALAEVRKAVPTLVATGETNVSVAEFTQILAYGAADILMPNVQRVGGITPWRKIAAAAELRGIPIASHVQPEIQVHLMCAVENGYAFEHVPWWPWPFQEPLEIRDGKAMPPDSPGLGVTLDPAFIERHRIG